MLTGVSRERHPDRNIASTEAERKVSSANMAQLNGAYAVLSDAKLRHEYDEKLKILSSLHASSPASRVTETGTKSKSGQRAAPRNDVDSTLARELSKQLRINLLAHHKGFSWKEKILEGFDWGLEGSSWSSHYCVAGRGFGVLDPAAAKKFTNYSEVIIARCNRSIRKSHFLFLLPFQRLSEWESYIRIQSILFGRKPYKVLQYSGRNRPPGRTARPDHAVWQPVARKAARRTAAVRLHCLVTCRYD